MSRQRLTLFFLFCLVGLLQLAAAPRAAAQGSLIPPGPPGPTMKSLDQVEPRKPIKTSDLPLTITQPGSYYLTETIKFATPATNGIVISSDNVTIDLGGFSLIGPWTTGAKIGSAIITDPLKLIKYVRIMNGTITGWGGAGINLDPTSQTFPLNPPGTCQQFMISQITSSGNGGRGIAGTTNGLIDQCIVSYNGDSGIEAQFWCTVTHCHVIYNAGNGIAVDLGCRVSDNMCVNNGRTTNNEVAGINARAGAGGGRNQILNNYLEANQHGLIIGSSQGNMAIGNYAFNNIQENFQFLNLDGFIGPVISQGNLATENPPNANFSYK